MYRNLTTIFGVLIILVSVINIIFDIISFNNAIMFFISLTALVFVISDIVQENCKNPPRTLIKYIDWSLLPILIISVILGFVDNNNIVSSMLFLPVINEVLTVIVFGSVVVQIGARNSKFIKKDAYTMESKEAVETMYDLAKYESNTVNKYNKVINQLKDIDNKTRPHHKVHNGWSQLCDALPTPLFVSSTLSDIYEKFYSELDKAIVCFVNLSDSPTQSNIGEFTINDDKYSVVSFNLIPNSSSTDEYKSAYESIDKAINYWDKLITEDSNRLDKFEYMNNRTY